MQRTRHAPRLTERSYNTPSYRARMERLRTLPSIEIRVVYQPKSGKGTTVHTYHNLQRTLDNLRARGYTCEVSQPEAGFALVYARDVEHSGTDKTRFIPVSYA